jgi:uncharacterized protein YhaN
MRIDHLVIRHYGPLEPRTLDFSAGAEGLHVVYGGNEWGKSLSLQALEHGLFSVPRKIEGFSDQDMSRLELEFAISRRIGDGPPQRCVFRRLRQGLTTATGDDAIDERQVLAYLGRVTPESFRQMYGLTAERIREGGRLLQKAKGDIAAALFAAATGLERIRSVTKSLEARQGGLFSASGNATNPRLNSALLALRQHFREYSTALQLPQATAQLETSLADKEAALATVEEELRVLSSRAAHLARVRAARSAAVELQAARQRLANLGDPRRLAETFPKRLESALEAIARADTLRDQYVATLERQRGRRAGLVVDERVLAAAMDIQSLVASSEELVGIDSSLPSQTSEIERHAQANLKLFAEITATTGTPLRETAVQAPGTHKQIEDLITAHGGIVTACDQREARVKECRESLDRTKSELRGLPVVGDIAGAGRRVQAVRDGGDLEKQAAAKRGELASAEGEYAIECSRLQGRQTDDPAEQLHVPTLVEVAEHRDAFRRFDNDRAQIDREERDAAEQIASLESQIALLEQEADLPADGELDAVRGKRDAAITATGADVVGGALLTADAVERFTGITRLVREADDVVDRLLRHADRASQRRQHHIAIERLQGQLGRLRTRRDELENHVAAAERAWTGLWQDAHVIPGSPTAMEAWLAVHAACCTRAAGLRKLRQEIAGLQQAVDADRGCLAGVLMELGVDPPAEATRKHLLDTTTDALAELQTQAAERQQKVDKVAELERELPRLMGLLEEEKKKRDSWNTRWADCMAVLDQPSTVSTDTGRFLLDTMRAVTANEEKISAARARVTEMESRRAVIHDIMRLVCEAIDRPFEARAVREISRAASERLQANQAILQDRQTLDREIRETEDHIDATRRQRGGAEAVLAVLREESGVATSQDLAEAWNRSERFREVRSQVDEWEQKFLREVGEVDADALLEECVGTEQADIDDETAEIDREAAEKKLARDRLRDERNDLGRQVEALGGDKAARAWAECRMHEAEVLERVAEYLPLRLASLALERASRRYRDEHQAPVLGRASTLFARITNGRYSAIRLAENDIYAVRADSSTESVFQQFMSDGTRDQIYLALRLAALQHSHEQGAEPLPLILDDGLVQFDDDRTAAMLEVLAEISSGMQVILFTHHKSVAAAARRLQCTRPAAVFLQGDTAA